MRPINLQGFEAKFVGDRDPWSTWTDADEAPKSRAIIHDLGAGVREDVLELGAGTGSNGALLATRALGLDAAEVAVSGTKLVADANTHDVPRDRAYDLATVDRPLRAAYGAIVIAELLYELTAPMMDELARQVARLLQPVDRCRVTSVG